MSSTYSFGGIINAISDAFIGIGKLEENDFEARAIITQCHEVYTVFHDQMRGIYTEYNDANERLDFIRLELLIAEKKGVLNTSIADKMKTNTYYLIKTLDSNKEGIISTQKKVIQCQNKTNIQEQDLDKNSPGIGVLKEVCQTVANGTLGGFLTVGIAKKMILTKALKSSINLVTGPTPIIVVASLYTVITRWCTYFERNNKKSLLSTSLIKISRLLATLLETADAFNVLHTKTLKELHAYLRSIDNVVKLSVQEGPLSRSVLIEGMLQKTKKVQTSFEGMTTLAEDNAGSLRRSLLSINANSIINS